MVLDDNATGGMVDDDDGEDCWMWSSFVADLLSPLNDDDAGIRLVSIAEKDDGVGESDAGATVSLSMMGT